jgi:phosphoglycerol transferase MdoB-like AlkP superfamily enzyme
MRQFVQTFMQNKLKDTLPQALERCGYRNVVFYPLLKNFVSNERFYNSIGLREVFDLKAQEAKSAQERDRFYYDNAMAEMARHFKASSRPLFTYIQTMSAHWPYDFAFEPNVHVAGGGPGTDPEMHEYLRRVSLAKLDYDYLVGELQRRFPGERLLIVHYGDHHPMATRTLLGYKGAGHKLSGAGAAAVPDPRCVLSRQRDAEPCRPAAFRLPSRAHAPHGIVPGALL